MIYPHILPKPRVYMALMKEMEVWLMILQRNFSVNWNVNLTSSLAL